MIKEKTGKRNDEYMYKKEEVKTEGVKEGKRTRLCRKGKERRE